MIKISSGEYCDFITLEVIKCPDVSILVEQNNTTVDVETYVEKNKLGFATILSKIYNVLKSDFRQDSVLHDVSIDLTWFSEKVDFQTYKANIRFFLTIRAIDFNASILRQRLINLKNIFISSLTNLKYTVIDSEGLPPYYLKVNEFGKNIIVKEDSVCNLQSYLLQSCYAYDKIPASNQNLALLTNYLSENPNCVVSFQIIPTYFTNYEKMFLEKTSSVLDTVNRGMHDASIGNIINPVAERYAAKYKYYEKNKDAPLFAFNILTMANAADLFGLTANVLGLFNIESSQEDKVALRTMTVKNTELDFSTCFEPLPWILNDIILDKTYNEYPVYYNENFDFRRLSTVITTEEASEFFRLPIGSKNTTQGLKIDYAYKDAKEFHKKIINTGDIPVGRLKSSFDDNTIGFNLKDVNKHMLIVGVPGMGKTTYSVGLLHTLWEKHKIPFLVIEPAKTEYRAMVGVIPDLQIFTFAKNDISPMPINPFVPPKGVKLKQYKSVLKTAFSAGVSMAESLSKLFEETIDECYSDFGWLDSDTVDSGGEIFNIQDFAKCFKKTFERHGYVGEAKNVGTAGLLRLVSMANLFDNYYSVPIEDMLSKPTIIELAAVQNKEEKSFLMALILLNVSAYIDNNYLGTGKLRNIILIEEAHNLLATSDGNDEGGAQPNAVAQELVKNMLAEKRSQGLGIVIADQSPEKVGADVIKLTNVKLGFNLVEKNDKEIFANSTNMDEKQVERMTQLVEGEGFFFMGGMSKPEELLIPDYRANHNIEVTISDADVKEKSTYWNGKEDLLKPYPECGKTCFCKNGCSLIDKEIAKNIARRLFNKYFTEKSADIAVLQELNKNLIAETEKILNGRTVLTKKLFFCIKIQLLRSIKYGTQINITDKLVDSALEKAKEKKEQDLW